MNKKKQIVNAQADQNGNIKAVKLEGNKTFTPIETAIKMTEKEQIDAVVVTPQNAKQHIRTKPGSEKNLDDMANDK